MKVFKWVVSCNAKSVGLFPVVVGFGLLESWEKLQPSFGWSDPILFRYSHARFLVRELRRTGYYVSAKPYVLLLIKDCLIRCKDNFKNRKAVRNKWRK